MLYYLSMSEENSQNNTTKGRQPTLKQRSAFVNMVENGGNTSQGMRDAGYSDSMVKNPHKLTRTKVWKQLKDEYFSEDLLAQVHQRGLNAKKTVLKWKEVEEVQEDGSIKMVNKRVPVEVDDLVVQHRYLDTAYKVRGMYPKEPKVEVNNRPAFSLAELAHKSTIRKQMGLKPITNSEEFLANANR